MERTERSSKQIFLPSDPYGVYLEELSFRRNKKKWAKQRRKIFIVRAALRWWSINKIFSLFRGCERRQTGSKCMWSLCWNELPGPRRLDAYWCSFWSAEMLMCICGPRARLSSRLCNWIKDNYITQSRFPLLSRVKDDNKKKQALWDNKTNFKVFN